jgi:hypothetical protein
VCRNTAFGRPQFLDKLRAKAALLFLSLSVDLRVDKFKG